MRNLILAATAVIALSFTTSTAMADPYGHHHSHHYRGNAYYPVTPYQAYRSSPPYWGGYQAYRVPNYGSHCAPNFGYGYGSGYGYPSYGNPGYSSSGIGVNGRNFSLYFGF